MNELLKYVHDNEVANIQHGIKLGKLDRGVIVIQETEDDKFEMNVFVVPTVPVAEDQTDPAFRLHFRDPGKWPNDLINPDDSDELELL